ncbi:hypothetical protein WA158_007440 [Blastocystis sp. Blastoise]
MFADYKKRNQKNIHNCLDSIQSPLLVIAHPDDESMFYVPTVDYLVKHNKNLHILCFTTGNFNGLGEIRKQELYKAAMSLGIKGDNVEVLDDKNYLDGMKAVWDINKAVKTLSNYIHEHSIDCIFTFDNYGVSGHPNHISCFQICVQYLQLMKIGIPLYTLQSVSIIRKYIGVFDYMMSLMSKHAFMVYNNCIIENIHAMKSHASQFVWFRWLFVLFSRYTTINTWNKIE